MLRSSEASPRLRHRFLAAFAAVALGILGAVIPAASASAVGGFEARLVDQLGQPAVGVTVQLSQRTNGNYTANLVTDGAGEFGATTLADGQYEAFVAEGASGTGSQRFSVSATNFTIVDGAPLVALGDIVVNRYLPVTGEIANWSAAMGDVWVTLWWRAPGGWGPLNLSPQPNWTVSTDGEFTISAPIVGGDYTLLFQMDEETSPYVDAFLGGEYDDPALATHVTGIAGTAISGITATMGDAAVITGRVTGGGGPLAGIEVEAENEDDYASAFTDAFGDYTIYVRPGSDYMVYTWGDNDYAGMVYDGWDTCGCEFDPVSTSVADPAEGIDFELLEYSVAPQILGFAYDDQGQEIDDLEVRLYRVSGGVWVLEDVVETDFVSVYDPTFSFLLDPPGVHRVQFVDDDGDILSVIDGATGPIGQPGEQLSPLPACYASAGDVQDQVILVAVLDTATAGGVCGSIEGSSVSPTSPGGSTGTPVAKPRPVRVAAAPAVTPSPTPTPTPTPSPTAAPRPTGDPAPEATDEPGAAAASAPDLWWLLWAGLATLVILVVGGVILILRRR